MRKIASILYAVVFFLLVSQAIPDDRWNNVEDMRKSAFLEGRKRNFVMERLMHLCGITTHRQDRCRLGVRKMKDTFYVNILENAIKRNLSFTQMQLRSYIMLDERKLN